MSFKDLKVIDDGGRLTFEQWRLSASEAKHAAWGKYNLTTGLANEREKTFYQDNPRATLDEINKSASENPVDLNNMTEKQKRYESLTNKMVSFDVGSNKFVVSEGKEVNDRVFFDSIDFSQDGEGRQTVLEGLLDNNEIKQIVESSGSSLDTKELDKISRHTLSIMILDKNREEKLEAFDYYRKGGFVNHVSYYGTGFAKDIIDPVAIGIGAAAGAVVGGIAGGAIGAGVGFVGNIVKGASRTIGSIAYRSSRLGLTASKLAKSRELAKSVARQIKRKKAVEASKLASKGVKKNKVQKFLDTSSNTTMGTIGRTARTGSVYQLTESILTEPFFYKMAQNRQEDYGISDSVLNIVFGGLAGAVLGGTVGAVGRLLRNSENPIKPKSIQSVNLDETIDILTTVHNQIATGNKVDIQPMVDLIPKQHYQNLFDSATNNNNNLRPITKKVKSDKTIVKTEEKPQNEEYLRHESQIKDLREVIQNLKIKMKSNRSEKAIQKFDDSIKVVEKQLNEGRFPEFNTLPPSLRREINQGELIKRDPVAQETLNTLDSRIRDVDEQVQPAPKEEDIEEPVDVPLDEDGEPNAIYTKMKNEAIAEEGNELDALDDTQFNALIEKIKGCKL
jgi:hypothetical protein